MGLPLVSSLEILTPAQKNKYLRKALEEVNQEIVEGAIMSEALGRHQEIFDEYYINMIEAAEAGGVFDRILPRVAAELRKKNKAPTTNKRGHTVFGIGSLHRPGSLRPGANLRKYPGVPEQRCRGNYSARDYFRSAFALCLFQDESRAKTKGRAAFTVAVSRHALASVFNSAFCSNALHAALFGRSDYAVTRNRRKRGGQRSFPPSDQGTESRRGARGKFLRCNDGCIS